MKPLMGATNMSNERVSFGPWPVFTKEEIAAVTGVLESGKVNYWTGNNGKQFEKEFADYIGVKHAVAVANGTLALELALATLDIGPGDEVIVPSCTFIATASAVVMRGAKPVCADIEPYTQNISVSSIQSKLTDNTRAIICVHLGGYPCDMDGILALANETGLKVIEDCAQAHGGIYKGQKLGSMGHISAFSFCQDKIMSTGGEGGMVVTNDEQLWKKAWSYKDHGKDYDKVFHFDHPPGFRWLHERFGTNWRLTEMQSAIGRIQLSHLEKTQSKREENANRLVETLKSLPLFSLPPELPDNSRNAWYKFYTFLNLDKLADGWDRDRVMAKMSEAGVPCYTGSCCEIYKENAFDIFPDTYNQTCSTAADMETRSLLFLIHPSVGDDAIKKTMHVLKTIAEQATAKANAL